jgi:hypothetical protein
MKKNMINFLFFVFLLLIIGFKNVFFGNPNSNLSSYNYLLNSTPDSLLVDSLSLSDFNSYIRKEPIHPDSISLKKEKYNLLPDSLKRKYE